MKIVSPILAVFLLVTTLGSCNSSRKTIAGAPTAETIFGKQWQLKTVMGNPVPTTKASLYLTNGKEQTVTGNTGCNRITGRLTTEGSNGIRFLPMATTKMARLEEGAATIETSFLAALVKADQWRIENNELQLLAINNPVATFAAVQPLAEIEQKLNGTWELTYISGPRIALNGLFPEKKPRIIFNLSDTLLTGNGGCNGFSSVLKMNGNTIGFGHPLSAMMACEGNGEPAFFKALTRGNLYRLEEDNTMTLLKNDQVLLRFVKR